MWRKGGGVPKTNAGGVLRELYGYCGDRLEVGGSTNTSKGAFYNTLQRAIPEGLDGRST